MNVSGGDRKELENKEGVFIHNRCDSLVEFSEEELFKYHHLDMSK